MNISLPGNAVHESDLVQVKCIIDYKGGGWTPAVNCTPEVPVPRLRVQETVGSFDRASFIGEIAAADIANWTVISCEIRFVLTEVDTPVSDRFERVLDTPRYRHTWHASPIRIFNTTGTLCVQVCLIKMSAVVFFM